MGPGREGDARGKDPCLWGLAIDVTEPGYVVRPGTTTGRRCGPKSPGEGPVGHGVTINQNMTRLSPPTANVCIGGNGVTVTSHTELSESVSHVRKVLFHFARNPRPDAPEEGG